MCTETQTKNGDTSEVKVDVTTCFPAPQSPWRKKALLVSAASVVLGAAAIVLAVLYALEVTKPQLFVDSNVNPCAGSKPKHADPSANNGKGDYYFSNEECMKEGVVQVAEQAGANVTKGYKGKFDAGGRTPITTEYSEAGLCPVNVHWHLGAEHLSMGQYDEKGHGPGHRRELGANVRQGFQCHHYKSSDSKFTKAYNWKHCKDMDVGQTYEIHWPHSAAGDCGTRHQYQTPFYDGVFCNGGIISLDPLNTYEKIGVQSQVFTIVNDESYYVGDLIEGATTRNGGWQDVSKYTGSTTGTSRDNTICSKYTPITWQVDRKCHMVSASSFDKLCADMKMQADDMDDDLHAHGARTLVAQHLAADNMVRK